VGNQRKKGVLGLTPRLGLTHLPQVVRYLLAQGYEADDLVVLTPYLGQLRALKEALGKARCSPPVLAFTRYCFTSQLYCGRQSSLPPSTFKSYPIAILLHDHCATYAPPPPPPPCMPYTIQYWWWHYRDKVRCPPPVSTSAPPGISFLK